MFRMVAAVKKGSLEVICGSMFSGKSEELIRRLKRAQIARCKVISFKHSLDNERTKDSNLKSHNGTSLEALAVDNPHKILSLVEQDYEIVGIDEVQFFSNEIINVVCALVEMGKRVIVAGLDLDFRGIPFGCVPLFMAIADCVTKLKAICICCGNDAHFTQRLVNGHPARHDDPLILTGAEENYQARCRSCHRIDQNPTF